MLKSSDETLVLAMRVLVRDIPSDDGIANSAIAEAADRIESYAKDSDVLPRLLEIKCRIAKQDGEWHIFERDGNGVAHGATFQAMLEALQHVDVEQYERNYIERRKRISGEYWKADCSDGSAAFNETNRELR